MGRNLINAAPRDSPSESSLVAVSQTRGYYEVTLSDFNQNTHLLLKRLPAALCMCNRSPINISSQYIYTCYTSPQHRACVSYFKHFACLSTFPSVCSCSNVVLQEQPVFGTSRECRRLNKVVADVSGLCQTLFFKVDSLKDSLTNPDFVIHK